MRGSVPVWVAGFAGNARPIRRAVRHDGYFPVNVTSSDQLAEIVAAVREQLADDRSYDVAAELVPGRDPAPYAAAGATWTLTDLAPDGLTLDTRPRRGARRAARLTQTGGCRTTRAVVPTRSSTTPSTSTTASERLSWRTVARQVTSAPIGIARV